MHRLARAGDHAAAVVADLGFALHLHDALADPPAALCAVWALLGSGPTWTPCAGGRAGVATALRADGADRADAARNPLGRGRKVGGRDWGERRLFDQVRARDADFVLLRQAAREIRGPVRPGSGEELRRGAGPTADPVSAAVAAVAVRRGLDAGGRRPGGTAGDAGGSAAAAARGPAHRRGVGLTDVAEACRCGRLSDDLPTAGPDAKRTHAGGRRKSLCSGEDGIRTRGGCYPLHRFSKPALSAAQPPLH